MQAIIAWITAHPMQALAIGLALYAFLTKKITLQGLLQEIVKDIQNVVNPGPGPGPAPDPAAPTLDTLLQQLVAILVQARSKGDAALEQATLKLIVATSQK